jgi:hypothetical protein
VAVGGRSAAARKKTSSMIMGATTMPQSPPSPTFPRSPTASDCGPISRSSSRSTNDGYFPSPGNLSSPVNRQSLHLSPSSAPSGSSNPNAKNKRWSHPDLPLRANPKDSADTERGAVKPPPHPVIEERPSSSDSVDVSVDDYLDSPRLSQKVRHPQTGRIICFAEVGDPNGFAVFCCVGMGLTRYIMAFYDELALTLKLRLITADRPGIGESQADSTGTPLSWPGKTHSLRLLVSPR